MPTPREQFEIEHMIRTDGKIHLEPVNLDSCCESDLEMAKNHPALHADVRFYAQLKILAIIARKEGRIELAQSIEEKCEKTYNRMPKSCRW